MDPSSSARKDGEAANRGRDQAAKGSDPSNDMNSILEGQLLKFTSILKGGFLPRWFVLDPVAGTLTYYLSQEALKKKSARGVVNLMGAQVSPSDEDSQTFSVNAANGEIFKLKAHDAKERQLWVSRLRHVVETLAPGLRAKPTSAVQRTMSHGKADAQRTVSGGGRLSRSQTQTDGYSQPQSIQSSGPTPSAVERKRSTSKSRESSPHSGLSKKWTREFKKSFTQLQGPLPPNVMSSAADDSGPLQPIHQACSLASQQEQELRSLLEQQKRELRSCGGVDVHSDPNTLLMKATAQVRMAGQGFVCC